MRLVYRNFGGVDWKWLRKSWGKESCWGAGSRGRRDIAKKGGERVGKGKIHKAIGKRWARMGEDSGGGRNRKGGESRLTPRAN